MFRINCFSTCLVNTIACIKTWIPYLSLWGGGGGELLLKCPTVLGLRNLPFSWKGSFLVVAVHGEKQLLIYPDTVLCESNTFPPQ